MAGGEAAFAQDTLTGAPDDVLAYLWPQFCHVPAQTVAAHFGANGPCWSLSTACTSGTCAIGAAGALVATGQAPAALAVGADALCDITLAGFGSLGVYSSTRTRPFDADRSGMNIGEGAGAVLLEPLDRALGRGARPLALLAGNGNSSDAHHLSTPVPDGRGARAAIRAALGPLSPRDVGYVNAHGTGTLLNDAMEAVALAAELPQAAVSGIKGATGHTLGAAGVIEAIVAIQALVESRLPPTVGLHRSEFDLDLVRTTRQVPITAAMSVNFAFAGNNAALAFTRWQG
jgi:3-oxoacyl-[acyl-carrier-protein] synthase II